MRRFSLGFTRPTCGEAVYLADVLPLTTCKPRVLPRTSGVLSGVAVRGWNYPGLAVTTSTWIGEEHGQSIQIWAGSPTAILTRRGFIQIVVARPCELAVATLNPDVSRVRGFHGFKAANFYSRRGVGRVTITKVTGSLADQTMTILFSYRGGKGSLNPITRHVIYK